MNAAEGLKSEPLRAALRDALAGRFTTLEQLFVRYGGGPDPRPNLKLAAAFGEEMTGDVDGRAATRLLGRLAAEDAAPDMPPVFLPMAAAFGYVGLARARREVGVAWAALLELAGDERAPVRVATREALRVYALLPGRAREVVERATDWLETEDREVRYGATALALEVLSDHQTLSGVPELADALAYFSRVLAEAAGAPRSAERSDARRRLLTALPRALATAVAVGGEDGVSWLEAECAAAPQTDIRPTFADAVIRVQAASPVVGQRLRQALEGSAKPLRDPSRVRPGVHRGKASRRPR